MSGITLYKAQELATLENYIDEETGEIDIAGLESAQVALAEKRRAVVAYIKNQEAALGMVDTAIADLQGKRKSIAGRAESLKRYLLEHMKSAGVTEIAANDGTFSAKLYEGRDESVQIDDGAVFPPELCNTPKPPEPSKTKIKAAILAGQPIAGARIVKRDRLTIK